MKRRIKMSFGKNLQYLRQLSKNMTQEALAEKLNVSRQTISKWEMDAANPEMDKALEICRIFNCSLDNLFREEMDERSDAYSNLRVEEVAGFCYILLIHVDRNSGVCVAEVALLLKESADRVLSLLVVAEAAEELLLDYLLDVAADLVFADCLEGGHPLVRRLVAVASELIEKALEVARNENIH